jgi:hypothetical protein
MVESMAATAAVRLLLITLHQGPRMAPNDHGGGSGGASMTTNDGLGTGSTNGGGGISQTNGGGGGYGIGGG